MTPLTYILSALLLLTVVVLIVLRASAVRQKRIAARGFELLASQDFNNRLRHTGMPGPDKIVDLFNTMIDSLRSERSKNLEQENFLQLLIKASPMGVLILDFDRHVALANPAFLKITGTEESEIIDRKIDYCLSNAASHSALIREMLATPLGANELIRAGDMRTYRCYHLSFIQTGFRREFFLLENITEEVAKAEREAYETVIRTISHEINNTMGGVRTVLQTIADISGDADTIEVLESCDERCAQMCAFVSSYADVVRLPEPALQTTDLNAELSRMLPFLGKMVAEGISLQFKPATLPATVNIDINMMQQAVVNIVKNASESIKTGNGWIRISIWHEGNDTVLDIANNGEAISGTVARNLFRPFYSTKRDGRGIGLTLTAEILNRHKAHYSLRTYADGITHFQISLQGKR